MSDELTKGQMDGGIDDSLETPNRLSLVLSPRSNHLDQTVHNVLEIRVDHKDSACSSRGLGPCRTRRYISIFHVSLHIYSRPQQIQCFAHIARANGM